MKASKILKAYHYLNRSELIKLYQLTVTDDKKLLRASLLRKECLKRAKEAIQGI